MWRHNKGCKLNNAVAPVTHMNTSVVRYDHAEKPLFLSERPEST